MTGPKAVHVEGRSMIAPVLSFGSRTLVPPPRISAAPREHPTSPYVISGPRAQTIRWPTYHCGADKLKPMTHPKPSRRLYDGAPDLGSILQPHFGEADRIRTHAPRPLLTGVGGATITEPVLCKGSKSNDDNL